MVSESQYYCDNYNPQVKCCYKKKLVWLQAIMHFNKILASRLWEEIIILFPNHFRIIMPSSGFHILRRALLNLNGL